MGMVREFREFAVKGNVVDLAVGLIIGAAFGKIVTSFVNDVIMPPIGLLLGNMDFRDLFVTLNGESYGSLVAAREAGAPVIAYGAFLNTVLDFVIVAFAVFVVVKQMNRLRKPAPAAPTRHCDYCQEPVALQATKCPHCTAALGASPAPSVALAP